MTAISPSFLPTQSKNAKEGGGKVCCLALAGQQKYGKNEQDCCSFGRLSGYLREEIRLLLHSQLLNIHILVDFIFVCLLKACKTIFHTPPLMILQLQHVISSYQISNIGLNSKKKNN